MIILLLLSAISIDEAVERALRNHPYLRVARSSAAVAQSQIAVERALPPPEFRLSTNNFDLDTLTLKERTSLGLRWSPPRPREISLKTSIAKLKQQALEASLKTEESRVAATARFLFRRALVAEQRTLLAAQVQDLRRKRLQVIDQQVKAGLKEEDQRVLASFSLEEAVAEHRRAQSLAQLESKKLSRFLDPQSAEDLRLEAGPADLDLAPLAPQPAFLVERALSQRGELQAQALNCRQHLLSRKLAEDERYPWISFLQVSNRLTPIIDRGPWGWQVGVDLPIFRSVGAARAKVAAAQFENCSAQEAALRSQIREEVISASQSLEEFHRELADLDRLRTGPAQRALEHARAALARGQAEMLDVLDEEARILLLRDRWLEKRLALLTAEQQMEEALGRTR